MEQSYHISSRPFMWQWKVPAQEVSWNRLTSLVQEWGQADGRSAHCHMVFPEAEVSQDFLWREGANPRECVETQRVGLVRSCPWSWTPSQTQEQLWVEWDRFALLWYNKRVLSGQKKNKTFCVNLLYCAKVLGCKVRILSKMYVFIVYVDQFTNGKWANRKKMI